MAFNISDFRGQLEFGGARPSLFEVQIFNPANTTGDLKTPFLVRAAQLPGSTVGTVPVSYFGRQIKLAGNRTFGDWTVTIINDEDFLIRNALEEWNNTLSTREGNLRTSGNTPASYKSTALVRQFGKDGEVIRVYEFDGLWCCGRRGNPRAQCKELPAPELQMEAKFLRTTKEHMRNL